MRDEQPDIVVVVGADHVYRMDFSQMVDQHIESGAACTVAAIRQPISLADQFGVIDVEPDGADPDPRVPREADRPAGAARQPRRGARVDGQLRLRRRRAGRGGHPRRDDRRLQARHGRRHRAGVRTAFAGRRLRLQGQRGAGLHRPGPRLLARRRDARRRTSPRTWTSCRRCRCSTSTTSQWPIYTSYGPQPPAKLVQGADGTPARADEAVLSPGVVVSGGTVLKSVLSPVGARSGPAHMSRARC